MKSIKQILGSLTTIALLSGALLSQAQAAPTVSLSITGATVDIVADGLPSAAGGFSLLLDYDGSLTFFSYAIGGPAAAGPLLTTLGDAPVDFSFGDLVGFVDLLGLTAFASLEADAFAAQNSGGPFVLGSVTFTGAIGAAPLGLRDVAISDFGGKTLLACTGAACAGTPQGVPEPMSALLVAVALGGLVVTRRKDKAAT